MSYQDIIYAKEKGVATITLNRPQRMNAYTQRLIEEMLGAIDDAEKDADIRVVVITGVGRSFCSGGDIGDFPPPPEESYPLRWVTEMREGFHKLLLGLRGLDKPTIASINGAAVAGGLVLALLCDIRIASDQARFGDGSLRLGFLPDDGGTYLLPRMVGLEKALELILVGEMLSAGEAQRIGLVSRVVPHNELDSATRELATRIAKGPPVTQRLAKQAIYRQLEMDLPSSLEDIALAAEIVNKTEDAAEGVKAFLEKREPIFRGK